MIINITFLTLHLGYTNTVISRECEYWMHNIVNILPLKVITNSSLLLFTRIHYKNKIFMNTNNIILPVTKYYCSKYYCTMYIHNKYFKRYGALYKQLNKLEVSFDKDLGSYRLYCSVNELTKEILKYFRRRRKHDNLH